MYTLSDLRLRSRNINGMCAQNGRSNLSDTNSLRLLLQIKENQLEKFDWKINFPTSYMFLSDTIIVVVAL